MFCGNLTFDVEVISVRLSSVLVIYMYIIVLCFLAATLPCVDTDIEEGNEDVSDDPHAKVCE